MNMPFTPRNYSLVGPEAQHAVEAGLANAEWYQAPISRKRLKELSQRSDDPAMMDTLIWLAAFVVTGGLAVWFWPSLLCIPFFLAYGVLYGSSSDSRWHECSHGTAFKTPWMNEAIYQLASFMIMREPTVWRWSHVRHHTDTIIVGRDAEIPVMRPTNIPKVIGMFFAIPQVKGEILSLLRHAGGELSAEEASFIPESERAKVYLTARIWLLIHLAVIGFSIYVGSILPMLLVGPLPTMYGAWVHVMTGLTQHAGLPEDVLDHRLNSRTVYMNPVLRFIYWNMNYHIEHHMFPTVPYHRLPELHDEIKRFCPPPYPGVIAAYREIVPALLRQAREPGWAVERPLPDLAPEAAPEEPEDIAVAEAVPESPDAVAPGAKAE
jgi:fatty acid desaturase